MTIRRSISSIILMFKFIILDGLRKIFVSLLVIAIAFGLLLFVFLLVLFLILSFFSFLLENCFFLRLFLDFEIIEGNETEKLEIKIYIFIGVTKKHDK